LNCSEKHYWRYSFSFFRCIFCKLLFLIHLVCLRYGNPNDPTFPSSISLKLTDLRGLSSQIPSLVSPPLSYIHLSGVRQLTTNIMMVNLPAPSPPLQTPIPQVNQALADPQTTWLITDSTIVYRVTVAAFNRTAIMEMVTYIHTDRQTDIHTGFRYISLKQRWLCIMPISSFCLYSIQGKN